MIFAYIYEFISFIFEKVPKEDIKNIILYGSVASGEFDESSDVDIFIEVWDKKKEKTIENKIKEQLNRFEEMASRTWYTRGIKNNFSIIVGDLSKWKNIEYDIISNGISLYGKFEKMPKNIQHNVLISFSLNKISQTDKMKFIRELYGYEIKKGMKIYKQEGLLEEYNGIKLSSNSILVPIEKIKEFRKLFSKFKLSPEMREVWIK